MFCDEGNNNCICKECEKRVDCIRKVTTPCDLCKTMGVVTQCRDFKKEEK